MLEGTPVKIKLTINIPTEYEVTVVELFSAKKKAKNWKNDETPMFKT